MKKIIRFIVILASILLISAFLAPFLAQFLDYKFHRIFTRCIMIGVLGWAVWAYTRADKSNFKGLIVRYGLQWKKKESASLLVKGFFTAFLLMCLLMVVEVFLGARIIQPNIKSKFLLQIVEYTFAAFIIGFIEEFFFRGMIFNKLRNWSLSGAFFLTSIFYSLVHFFKANDLHIEGRPAVADSFRLMGALLEPFADPAKLWPGVVGLTIFGLVLSYSYWRSKSLYAAVGIHAGAVFFLKTDGFLISINEKMPVFIYGDKNVYTGVLGWIFMGMIGVVMMFLIPKKKG